MAEVRLNPGETPTTAARIVEILAQALADARAEGRAEADRG